MTKKPSIRNFKLSVPSLRCAAPIGIVETEAAVGHRGYRPEWVLRENYGIIEGTR